MPDWVADHPVATLEDAEPFLAAIQRFPVKGLDRERRVTAVLRVDAALAVDRRGVIADRPAADPFDPMAAKMSDFINGKKTAAIHRIRSRFIASHEGRPALSIWRQGEESSDATRFELYDGRNGLEGDVLAPLSEWLSTYFDRAVSVRRVTGGRPDRTDQGPSVVATATLRELAAWFDIGLDSAR